LYRHYKGNLYQVLGIARHSETHEILVIKENQSRVFHLLLSMSSCQRHYGNADCSV